MTSGGLRRIGGCRLHVSDSGDGPPVLLINGLGAHTAMWAPLHDALRGLRVISFDAPGTGQSPTPRLPLTIPALARLATRVLDEVGVERTDVLGYSMGGLVAQQLTAAEPQRVRRLVLVGTSCGWGGIPGALGPMLNIATPLRYWSPAFYRRTVASMVGGRARRDSQWVERHGQIRAQHVPTARGYLAQVWAVGLWSTLPLLHHIAQPTLIVTGDDDPLVPHVNAFLLARHLPDARVLVAPNEGHLLLMDPDSEVLEPIREFLLAEPHHAASVWRNARRSADGDLQSALVRTPRAAQPWGVVSAAIRTTWPVIRPFVPARTALRRR